MPRIIFAPALFVTVMALAAVGFAACGSDSKPDASQGTPTSAPPPTIADSFERGDLEPKELVTYTSRTSATTLAGARVTDAGPYSNVSFFFAELVPDYDVRFVDEPISCGSGEPLDIEGTAFLQARFTPSRAHNDLGETTVSLPDDFGTSLPVILEIQQSCDFEGELTFVLGLAEKLDFSVSYMTQPLFRDETILIDIANP